MKCFFDTSVLVAAVLEEHQHHERSLAAFSNATRSTACCATHNLAEVYATLTRYPGKERLSAEQALLALDAIDERLTIVALDGKDYRSALQQCAANGILGATVYDGLIAACALKAKADVLYTWNTRDFSRLGAQVAKLARNP